MMKEVISWDFLYEAEPLLKQIIGGKERFVILGKELRRLFPKTSNIAILDGGGARYTSYILRQIFPNSFIVSVNISEGDNDMANMAIKGDLENWEDISRLSGVARFELIHLGEVFEHLERPYSTMKGLTKLLHPDGYIVITTPNLSNIYNRFLLLFGYHCYNYRPLVPGEHKNS